MFDSMGDRFKSFYEGASQNRLLRRTYSVVRVDGKAFHTYTRGLKRPFDEEFISDMNETALYLCKEAQGVLLGYVQSDEISIVLADFAKFNTSAWFDGNVQKIVSISSSLATARFNQLRSSKTPDAALAMFDARTFNIPSAIEVQNYLIWRQNDASRNSVSAVARSLFSHKELDGKNVNEMQEMIFAKSGINWNDYPVGQKRGRTVVKNPDTGEWTVEDPPIFSKDQEYLGSIFTAYESKVEK